MTTDIANHPSDSVHLKKQRAKARWTILRNALLNETKLASEHSIHRFSGFGLLRQKPKNDLELGTFKSSLKRFDWVPEKSINENIDALEIAILALASCFPKGCCIQIMKCPVETYRNVLQEIKDRCRIAVNLVVVDNKEPSQSVTLLVQETSSASTKFASCQYVLDNKCSLWTREPRESRLSLEDLVSHRTTGVDNTGNICVWDSERSLAYLLYHHYDDFTALTSIKIQNILELGAGMAGMAGISLGLRLAQLQIENKINVTLTDGHSDGVKNNLINQHLTEAYSKTLSQHHPYLSLSVSSRVLLWTTDTETTSAKGQDVVLVSDCTHFQNFHAALAITMLRSLRKGGVALFCQPDRGDSLKNFIKLLMTPFDLVSLKVIEHPILERENERALEQHIGVYDRNLHFPKILVVTKLRDLNDQDRHDFVVHQQNRTQE